MLSRERESLSLSISNSWKASTPSVPRNDAILPSHISFQKQPISSLRRMSHSLPSGSIQAGWSSLFSWRCSRTALWILLQPNTEEQHDNVSARSCRKPRKLHVGYAWSLRSALTTRNNAVCITFLTSSSSSLSLSLSPRENRIQSGSHGQQPRLYLGILSPFPHNNLAWSPKEQSSRPRKTEISFFMPFDSYMHTIHSLDLQQQNSPPPFQPYSTAKHLAWRPRFVSEKVQLLSWTSRDDSTLWSTWS